MSDCPSVNGEISSASDQQLAEAEKELEKWKELLKKADEEASKLWLETMDADQAKKKVQQETTDLMKAELEEAESCNKLLQEIQDEMNQIRKVNQDLEKKLNVYKEQLQLKRAEEDSLQQRFKIKAQIPEKRMKFTHAKKDEGTEEEEAAENTKAVFTITQRPSILLKGGQALITFEEENVANQILRLAKCSVPCDAQKVDVKPCSIQLEPSVKFEVHIQVSKRTITFSNAPSDENKERMRDRLELSFSRPSRGGGEVETLEYDHLTGRGLVTFLNTGVAEKLVHRGRYELDIGQGLQVEVMPQYEFQLKKFQTFVGLPKRTVLLREIQDMMDEEDLQDHLEIHFQKPSNYGGEVESIKYVADGKELRAFFSEDCAEAEE